MKPCVARIYYAGKLIYSVVGTHTDTQDSLMTFVASKIAVTAAPPEKDVDNE